MIGYVTVGTNDLPRAAAFYDAIAAEMGVGRMMEFETGIAWGVPEGGAGIAAMAPIDGNPATVGNGVMVALEARDKEQVGKLHAIALAHGGTCEGPPGLRSGGFHAAYF
ncbi:MAG: VOC family protein, partial [Novosphingobium sp.]